MLVPRLRNGYLPRRGSPLDHERELIADFARDEGLEPFWVSVDSRSDLIPFLLEGKGDLIAANLTATRERRDQVAFTVPVKLVREQVVVRRSDHTISQPASSRSPSCVVTMDATPSNRLSAVMLLGML